MEGGVIEVAMQAAAAARAEREARGDGAARRPVPRYRGVTRRGDMYVAEIMVDAAGLRLVCLGAYATAEEAAHAYAAAARIMDGNNNAEPNFPEPPAPVQVPVPVAVGGGRRVGVLPLVGHARVRRAPVYGQQPAPRRQALAATVGHARMRRSASLHSQQPAPPQGFSVQQAPAHTQHRELPVWHGSVTVQAIVGDNFTNKM